MSREASYTYSLPRVSVAESIDRYQETLKALLDQHVAQVDARQLAAANAVAEVLALRAVPELLEEVRAQAVPAARAVLDALPTMTMERVLADPGQATAVAALGASVPRAIEGTAAREQSALKGAIEGALGDIGYEIVALPPTPRGKAVLVRGRHESGTVMSFEVAPRSGRLLLDLEGFSNGACVKARAALLAALKARGVGTTIMTEATHAEFGGALTRRIDALTGRKTASKVKGGQANAASSQQGTSPAKIRG